MRFTGRIALVSAAGRGIGRESAEIIGREGGTVIAVDGRTVADAQAIFKATPGKPGSVTGKVSEKDGKKIITASKVSFE